MIEWLLLGMLLVVLLIAAIPLTIAVKLMGGEASLLKVVFAQVLIVAITAVVRIFVPGLGGFGSFILMIFVYKVMFQLGWLKTIFAWLLQGVIVVILVLVLITLGIGVALV